MLRCADLDLRERIRKYDLNVEDGAELDEQAFRNYLLREGGRRAKRSTSGCYITRAAI